MSRGILFLVLPEGEVAKVRAAVNEMIVPAERKWVQICETLLLRGTKLLIPIAQDFFRNLIKNRNHTYLIHNNEH